MELLHIAIGLVLLIILFEMIDHYPNGIRGLRGIMERFAVSSSEGDERGGLYSTGYYNGFHSVDGYNKPPQMIVNGPMTKLVTPCWDMNRDYNAEPDGTGPTCTVSAGDDMKCPIGSVFAKSNGRPRSCQPAFA